MRGEDEHVRLRVRVREICTSIHSHFQHFYLSTFVLFSFSTFFLSIFFLSAFFHPFSLTYPFNKTVWIGDVFLSGFIAKAANVKCTGISIDCEQTSSANC